MEHKRKNAVKTACFLFIALLIVEFAGAKIGQGSALPGRASARLETVLKWLS